MAKVIVKGIDIGGHKFLFVGWIGHNNKYNPLAERKERKGSEING
jgi:hypothetical protein